MLLEEFKFLVEELGKINDDPEPVHDEVPKEQHHEEPVEEKKPTDMRAAIRKAIEPSVAVAKSIIEAIGDSAETTGTSKKMKDQEQQVKNFENRLKVLVNRLSQLLKVNTLYLISTILHLVHIRLSVIMILVMLTQSSFRLLL